MNSSFFSNFPVMILAAGRGERMRPLTDSLPKPLLEVKGKSLLQYHLEGLKGYGFERVVINHAWLGQLIENAFGNGSQLGLQINYSSETIALETAGGIAKAIPLLQPSDYFLVLNGDTFIPEFPFEKIQTIVHQLRMYSLPLTRRIQAYLFLVPNPSHHPHGDFYLFNDYVFSENPISPNSSGASKYTFSGAGIYHKNLFNEIPIGTKHPLAPLLKKAMMQRLVKGEVMQCSWHDVGTPDRLLALNK
jgi:MurNAc alpha-1-phosphate uridylyltransferase